MERSLFFIAARIATAITAAGVTAARSAAARSAAAAIAVGSIVRGPRIQACVNPTAIVKRPEFLHAFSVLLVTECVEVHHIEALWVVVGVLSFKDDISIICLGRHDG